jgi:hypothetical protein
MQLYQITVNIVYYRYIALSDRKKSVTIFES